MHGNNWIHYYILNKKIEIKLCVFKAQWRQVNTHNETIPGCIFPMERVHVGKGTYGELNVFGFDDPNTTLTIGNYCSLAGGIHFWIGGEHPTRFLSTYPFAHKFGWKEKKAGYASKGSVVVGDDVWIGEGAIILSGVSIGQGAVIGAGSVVTKDVPPYSIYAGGRIIRSRFDPEVINKLTQINYNLLDLERYRDIGLTEITKDNCDSVLDYLNGDVEFASIKVKK